MAALIPALIMLSVSLLALFGTGENQNLFPVSSVINLMIVLFFSLGNRIYFFDNSIHGRFPLLPHERLVQNAHGQS
jgi:hypothetical protein